MHPRDALLDRLHAALEALPAVEAAWVGGSAAFGRADRFSDLDLCASCAPEHDDAVFAAVEAAMGPVLLEWRVPSSASRGLRQRFYRLVDQDPHHFVDLCLMDQEALALFLDPVRHGRPRVLFDREGLLERTPPATVELDERLHQAVVRFRFFARVLVERAVGRGRILEASWAWQGFVLTPLIEVLRARHCPARQDFGPRYTDVDLPGPVHAELCSLALVQDLPDFLEKLRRAERLFELSVEALVAEGRLPSDGRVGRW